jgi:gliding motility-associated-like protein
MNFSKIIPPFFVAALLCVICVKTQAQLCTGSLGDPVVNIDFGTGFGGNTGYTPTSSYNFAGGQCPNDGFYTITRQSLNCFGNTWHSVTADHTGNGAFLLVNASYAPGDFIVTRVTNLCPNITYEFAAWVLNILNRSGIKPNITFTIETESGTVLQQYNTGDIPETFSPLWRQYGFFFTTPVNNPVIVLRMRNNAPGGLGNDIAMDDITFRPCSSIRLTSNINGNNGDTVNVCEGLSGIYNVTGSVNGIYTSPVYQWQLSKDSGTTWQDVAGATSLNYAAAPVMPGAYWYRFTATESNVAANTACRIASNYVAINIQPKPVADAGGNRIYIIGTPITLNGTVTGNNAIINWQPPSYLSDAAVLNPQAEPPADITYVLQAASPFGCYDFDTAFIKVIKGIFVPNVFTPGKDGKNDNWRIPFLDASLNAKVSVYNRYGQQMFYCQGCIVNWDGTFKGQPLPAGTYVYVVQFSNGYPDIKGSVLLLR